jgi:6-phosphogluconolactonase
MHSFSPLNAGWDGAARPSLPRRLCLIIHCKDSASPATSESAADRRPYDWLAGQSIEKKPGNRPRECEDDTSWTRTKMKNLFNQAMKRSVITKHLGGIGLGLAVLTTTAKADDHGAVYTMDNASGANHVLVFDCEENGRLTPAGSVATGGAGTGAGLSSQGSVLLSHDGRWLFTCNAASDEISVFASDEGNLQLVDKVNSAGHSPVSLALHHNLLYVLNAGGLVGSKDNVTAFLLVDGKLVALPDSTRALSGDNTGPAQVSFTQDGDALVVTERQTSLIDTFALGDDGLATSHKTFVSAGTTPFGFAVGRNDRIFVSEASGVPNGSSASSYSISDAGDLEVISAVVPTEQKAACWLTLTPNGHFAYTANAGSGSLSGFKVGLDGTLHLLDPNGITAVIGTGSHPIDMATSRNGRFLFSLANGNGTLGAFRITSNGSLDPLGSTGGLPTSAAGLAAR